ncbi:sulfate adenylyltransferase, large subunit [Alkaliphilus metalliredigens QYMF]|uniref:sulfate adenylyltransferase n=1 Tax=Alkaliphilus metalliredigens (strain QYMF) TaxID=293826 RepID=A6TTV2_ALKMQ|nr:GTP-binding protein [Alkaliphilus metalliredigens]ABR49620.1 sulfate adenylyltransferase, large subunit [Alkaliphilus metalliredigens QYMF]
MMNNNLDENQLSVIESQQSNMNIVIVGHVDHGKSTIIGRLLADTGSLPEGKLEQVKETCRKNAKPFEYAFLLDALKDEQSQGITIDSARVFFKTQERKYIIIDAPGHIEFLKNMVTGAARAEVALLVIDAKEGVKENSKRHGYLLSMLGIKQVVVLINKMDLVDYSKERYEEILAEYKAFLSEIDVEAESFIPISGFKGENVASGSDKMPWYSGMTVLEKLDGLKNIEDIKNQAFRMPVQGIYKFTAGGDDRRIVAGTIDTGKVKVGHEMVFYPSGKKSKVKSIERFNAPKTDEDVSGSATGFTLEDQIYITRGELACIIGERQPEVSTQIKTKLFWLGKEDLNNTRDYYLKMGTQKVKAALEEVITVLDASTLTKTERQYVQRHEVAEVIFKLEKAIAFDKAENSTETSRFVLVDNYEISGGGIIVDNLENEELWLNEKNNERNIRWSENAVTRKERAGRFVQRPTMVVISGEKGINKKEIASYIERGLFTEGRNVYYMDTESVFSEADAEVKEGNAMENREKQFKEFAKASNFLLDSGNIVIATINEIEEKDINIINTMVSSENIKLVWIGNVKDDHLPIHIHVEGNEKREMIYQKVKKLMIDTKIIFQPEAI